MNEISIIGGGIGGLYFTYVLSKNTEYTIHIYEKMKHCGGRVMSQYNENGELLYECGPWRISTHHKRVLSLVNELGLTLKKIKQPIVKKGFEKKWNFDKHQVSIPNTNQLTEYQYRCIHSSSIEKVNNEMIQTGYDEIFERANTTRSYSLQKSQEEIEDFYVVVEGFSEIINRLVKRIQQKSNVHFHYECRVDNVDFDGKNFFLWTQHRVDSKTFHLKKKKTKYLVLALPPHEIKLWKGLTLQPNLEMVESLPLMHVYGLVKNFTKKNEKYICNSPISQIISSCYSNNWIQLSYSGGRFATQLQNLLLMSKNIFENYVKTEFYHYFPKVSIQKMVPHFWRHAVHLWRPNLKTKEVQLKKKCIHPHPTKYPNLYWIGESISSKQGWMEGALETTEDVFMLWKQEKKIKKKKVPKEYVVYDGRILNVEKWKNIHPGGKDVIINHLGEDITKLWKIFHGQEISRYFPLLEE